MITGTRISPLHFVDSSDLETDASSILMINRPEALKDCCSLQEITKDQWHELLDGEKKVSDPKVQNAINVLSKDGALKTALTLLPDSVIVGSLFGDALVRSYGQSITPDEIASDVFRRFDKFEGGSFKGELPGGSVTIGEMQRGILRALRAEKLTDIFLTESHNLGMKLRPLNAPQEALPFLPRTFVGPSAFETQGAAALFATQFVRYNRIGYFLGGTGETQKNVNGLMSFLQDMYKDSEFPADYSNLDLGHIDQYLDCPDDAPESFIAFVKERLEKPLGFNPDLTDYIHGVSPDGSIWKQTELEREIFELKRRQVARVMSGVQGLVQMGVGPSDDPHIAFCPRGTKFMDRMNIYTLDSGTVERDLSRGQTGYNLAISYGARGVLSASNQFMTAVSADKGKSLAGGFTPIVTENEQLSAMLLSGRRTFLFIDEEAAAVLEESLRQHDWSDGIRAG